MKIQEAYEFIDKAASFGSRLGLDCIKELLERLENPQDQRPVVHIAGTNGKGSIFAFLESMLKKGGYRVGRYISPTLYDYLERFQINGVWMDEITFCNLTNQVKQVVDAMVVDGCLHPTAFEVETAIAFLYFAQQNVDVVLLETGMGGLEDATNVVSSPLATVFASISMDHMAFLGDTLEQIATVKSGIMRKGVPVICAPMDAMALQTLHNQAVQLNCPVYDVEQKVTSKIEQKSELVLDSYEPQERTANIVMTSFIYDASQLGGRQNESFRISLYGTFQVDNARTALKTYECIKSQFPLTLEQIKSGLASATWNGRFQILCNEPFIVQDGAHNPDAVLRLKESLLQICANRKIHVIMGVYKDKDMETMLSIIAPLLKEFTAVTPPNPSRALDSLELKKLAVKQFGDTVAIQEKATVSEALSDYLKRIKKEDCILIFGSLSLANEAKQFMESYRNSNR